jgi:RNA-dependent RNA polymerase
MPITSLDHLADLQDNNKITYQSQKVLGTIFRIVQPDPHFRPSDIKHLGYPADRRITRFPVFKSMIDRLKPIKARYEADMKYDMRRSVLFA